MLFKYYKIQDYQSLKKKKVLAQGNVFKILFVNGELKKLFNFSNHFKYYFIHKHNKHTNIHQILYINIYLQLYD